MALSLATFFSNPISQKTLFGSNKTEKFFKILLGKGYLTASQFNILKEESARLQKKEEEILLDKGLVSEDKLAIAYSEALSLPLINLLPEPIPQETLLQIPKNAAEDLEIIPLEETKDNKLKIGIANPFKLSGEQEKLLAVLTRKGIIPAFYIISNSSFRKGLAQYESSSLEAFRRKEFSPITLTGLEIPYQIITKLPQRVAEEYKMLVFGLIPGKLLKIAVVEPANPKVLEVLGFIEKRTGHRVEKYVISEGDFREALKIYKEPPPALPILPQPLIEKKPSIIVEKIGPAEISNEERELANLLKKDVNNIKELENIVRSGHVPKIVAAIINFACGKRATDVHIQPYEKYLSIRYRVDGLLRDIIQIPKEFHLAIISRIKILAKLKIDEQRIPQDGRFGLEFQGREVDIRVSTLPTANGEKIVLRLLDKVFGILTLEQLGLQGSTFTNLIKEIEKPHGVTIATGPTGCGKTSTLYAILCRLKNPTVNIVTLEDPVEYEIEGVNQSQIKPDIGFSFATGLRSILRQDPNMIMVGEIRDLETAQMVTHAALTGHLVLTTLHTNEAASTLPRLINMGIEPFLITSAINVIIGQRLVRRICQKCQEEIKPTAAVLEQIEKEITKMPSKTLEAFNIKKPFIFRKGRGCDECDKGYRGRIGIFEVLIMSPEIEDLAIKRRPASEIQEAAVKKGMVTMRQDGVLKVLQGITTYDEVLRIMAAE